MPANQSQAPAAVKPPVSPAAHPLLKEFPRLPGMSPATHEKLVELCGPRWIDLLLHLPTRLLDRTATPTIAEAPLGERATLTATVVRRPPLPPRHVKRPMAIELTDGTAPLRAVFFNAGAWLERAFPVDAQVILSGKIEEDSKGRKMIHPDVWANNKELAKIARQAPLYPLTGGIGQGWLTRAIQQALLVAAENPLPDWLPPNIAKQTSWPDITAILQQVHTPEKESDLSPATPARTALAFGELFANQLALIHARQQTRFVSGLAHGTDTPLTTKLRKSLPWPLTPDQQSALDEVYADLHAPRPMLRLLQGDVGAGKTLVALFSLLHVIENGQQGVLMAPTEILANQHYATAKKLLEPLGITVALLTGRLTPATKRKTKEHVKSGFVNLVIGTHALTQDDVMFDKLGLIVIDEQHRFGVHQRLALSQNQNLPPDILVMTATPIPRTLALTAYGDMDVSIIASKPPGRTPITTVVMPDSRLPEIATGLARVIASGQQVYWVCPLVDENEELDLAAATERFAALQKLYGDKVGLLHGQMKGADKDAAMQAFQRNETQILVSTTVIEVGVDVPNATLMVIEHAERFGLAQLHQLRGRVGRGAAASRCVLLYTPPVSLFGQQRLQALRESEDGFFLAEKDLELRGPGEVLGTRQSGQLAFRLADLFHHKPLIPVAREAAEKLLTKSLTGPQRNALLILLHVFNKQSAASLLRSG